MEEQEIGNPFGDLSPEDIKRPGSPEEDVEEVVDDSETEEIEDDAEGDELEEESEVEEEAEESEEQGEETEEVENSEEEDEVYTEDEYYSELSESIGETITSKEELIEKYSQLKRELEETKSKDPLESLSPLARDVDRAEKAGMDINTYLAARNANFEEMEGENILWEKFKKDNPSMMDDPELARERFKRSMTAEYGSLVKPVEDDYEDPADYRQALSKYESEKSYADKSKNFAIKQARQEMVQWQKENVTIPEAKDSEPAGLSQEEVEKNMRAYDKSVSDLLGEYNGFAFDLDGEEFNLELVGEQRQSIEQGLRNPVQFLRDEIGVDLESNSLPNLEKMAEAAMILKSVRSGVLADQMKTWVLEKYNKDTVTSKRENPRPKDKSIPSASGKPKTLAEEIAAAFKAQRG